MKNLRFDLLVNSILLSEGALTKDVLYQNKKFNLAKFKDKAEEAKEAMKTLAGAKWLGNVNPEKIESVFNQLIKDLGEEPITYSDLVTIIDSSVRNSFSRQDLRIKWSRQFRNMFERLNDIQETPETPVKTPEVPQETNQDNEKPVSVEAPSQKEIKEIRDVSSKRFWEKVLGEGEYSRKDLVKMMIEDNPDMDEDDAPIKVSDLIMSGFLKKTESGNYEAVDPSEETSDKNQEEGEGSGEVTSGISQEELDELDGDWNTNDLGIDISSNDEDRPFKI
jgi:hypothetical protein